jgi:DNA-directed RNA polymerase subunit RPC12/RpoP
MAKKPYGFKCDKCSHEALIDTEINGLTCPACGKGKLYHDINVKGGRLDAYSGLGGYPIIYIDNKSGDLFCAGCAEKERDGNGTPLIHDTYMEGAPEHCEECGEEIESAYGDPDAD